jgi:transglutaminase-like putative cysteine protease
MSTYLRSTFTAPASDSRIRQKAEQIVDGITDRHEQARAIIDWMQKNIENEPVDVFTAIDVLEKGRAECQGHALLYASLARAAGIPTRVVNGIVYSEDHAGFLYHTWAESCVDNQWISVDPTFGQVPSDATHVKFVEGESPDDLLPLVGVIGRIRAEIISVQ